MAQSVDLDTDQCCTCKPRYGARDTSESHEKGSEADRLDERREYQTAAEHCASECPDIEQAGLDETDLACNSLEALRWSWSEGMRYSIVTWTGY